MNEAAARRTINAAYLAERDEFRGEASSSTRLPSFERWKYVSGRDVENISKKGSSFATSLVVDMYLYLEKDDLTLGTL